MKNLVFAILPFVITIIVYAMSPIIFEMNDIAFAEGENFASDQNAKTLTDINQPQLVEKDCKSPCSESAEMCIEMCA